VKLHPKSNGLEAHKKFDKNQREGVLRGGRLCEKVGGEKACARGFGKEKGVSV